MLRAKAPMIEALIIIQRTSQCARARAGRASGRRLQTSRCGMAPNEVCAARPVRMPSGVWCGHRFRAAHVARWMVVPSVGGPMGWTGGSRSPAIHTLPVRELVSRQIPHSSIFGRLRPKLVRCRTSSGKLGQVCTRSAKTFSPVMIRVGSSWPETEPPGDPAAM